VSLAVPLLARAHLARRVDHHLEPALERAFGAQVALGGLEAGLTGTLRLDDIAVAGSLTAGSIELGYGPVDLLAGHLAPVELRVVRPHLPSKSAPTGRATSIRCSPRSAATSRGAAATDGARHRGFAGSS
jgi:hypothetical protein